MVVVDLPVGDASGSPGGSGFAPFSGPGLTQQIYSEQLISAPSGEPARSLLRPTGENLDMSAHPKPNLKFRFQATKCAEALVLFAAYHVPDLTKLKAVKLIYFADRQHMLRFGRPIVGGQYYCLDKGPVPSEALNAINGLASGESVRNPDARELAQKVSLQRSGWQIHPRVIAKAPPDENVFSESEMQIIKDVAAEYGRLSVGSLIEMSHAHEAWREADVAREAGGRAEMSYETFFRDNPVDSPVLEAAQVEQEDRDFADDLARAASKRRALRSR